MQFRVKRFIGGKQKPCIIEFDDSDGIPALGVFVVYGFTDPRSGQLFYIGQTDRFEIRMRAHVASSDDISLLSRYLRAIDMHGFRTTVSIIAILSTRDEALVMESHLIRQFADTIVNRAHNREWRRPIK